MKKAFAIVISIWIAACTFGCAPVEPQQVQEDPVFALGDTQIRLNVPAKPVLEELGAPISFTEAPSCAYPGVDRTYYFGNFYLSTSPSEEGEWIRGLWLADDSLSTAEGIRIGATQAEVEEAYGPECFNGINAYVLTYGQSSLSIILADGLVSGIRYDTTVN